MGRSPVFLLDAMGWSSVGVLGAMGWSTFGVAWLGGGTLCDAVASLGGQGGRFFRLFAGGRGAFRPPLAFVRPYPLYPFPRFGLHVAKSPVVFFAGSYVCNEEYCLVHATAPHYTFPTSPLSVFPTPSTNLSRYQRGHLLGDSSVSTSLYIAITLESAC